MNYSEIVNKLTNDFIFCSYDKEFHHIGYGNIDFLISGKNFILSEYLKADYYTIPNTNKTFHHNDIVSNLKLNGGVTQMDYKDALGQDKKIILQMELHPGEHNFDAMYDNYFVELFKDKSVLDGLKSGKVHLFLYFGFEADSFYSNEFYTIGRFKNYYEMLDSVIDDYNLPKNSIIILSSNQLGEEQDDIYYKNKNKKLGTIFDNTYEPLTFTFTKGSINLDYSFDEHISNLKKSTKRFLRVNRTQDYARDIMLYYLINSGLIDSFIVEQNKFFDDTNLKEFLNLGYKYSSEMNLNFCNFIKYDIDKIQNVKNNLPYIASNYEKSNSISKDRIYSNEVIPHDIYYNSILSWVSSSLPFRNSQVFINSSTFNPMLYYHPLIYHANPRTIEKLKDCGFKSFDFLYNEQPIDTEKDYIKRLLLSIKEVDKLLQMDKSELISILEDNQSTLEYNRNLLFECNSIKRILTKVYQLTDG